MAKRRNAAPLQRLYPAPCQSMPFPGLYLRHELNRRTGPFVYANFIASLDGRVAIASAQGAVACMPTAILNPRDWQLYLELAAQADMVLASASYLNYRHRTAGGPLRLLREEQDSALIEWRLQHGLAAQPTWAVVTRELALPEAVVRAIEPQPLYVVTSSQAPISKVKVLERAGARILCAGSELDVSGAALVRALHAAGFNRICSVAGPHVLYTLLADDCLNRLYLTIGLRLLGGSGYATLVEGGLLDSAPALDLESLYLDAPVGDNVGQLFGVYTRQTS
ncbi:MAG TPA: dihydrofolate reductase family protein [Gammaproteobacteria bacterium]|nr:dihydrofolate reductase family protein [Gammaproteobacteria bacterium]